MITKIAKQEIKNLIRDKRIFLLSILVFISLTVSTVIGWKYSSDKDLEQREAQSNQYSLWLNKGEMNPHSAAHHGLYVYKPYSILSMIDIGVEKFTGTSIFLEAHKRNQFGYNSSNDSNNLQRFGELTPSTVLQILFPLLIILIGFNSINSEKESGTLKQVLSLGVDKKKIIFGKFLGIKLVILGLISPFILLGLTLIFFSSHNNSDTIIRFIFMTLGYLIYLIIFSTLSFIVSLNSNSKKSLIILVCFWFISCFVMPKLIMNTISYKHKTQTSYEFSNNIEQKKSKIMDWYTREAFIKNDLKKTYNLKSDKDIPYNIEGLVLISEEKDETKIYNDSFNFLFDTYKQQNSLYNKLSVLSPTIAMQNISMSLSKTDFESFRDFNNSVEKYREEMVNNMNSAIKNYKKGDTFDYVEGKNLWEKVPPFKYQSPDYLFSVKHIVNSITVLIIWLFLLSFMLIISINRFRIV